jgi:hypothetical protein
MLSCCGSVGVWGGGGGSNTLCMRASGVGQGGLRWNVDTSQAKHQSMG